MSAKYTWLSVKNLEGEELLVNFDNVRCVVQQPNGTTLLRFVATEDDLEISSTMEELAAYLCRSTRG